MSTSSISLGQSAAPLRAAFQAAATAHKAGEASSAAPEAASAAQAKTPVTRAIANAARQTSVDFGFLVAQAQVESAMDPEAKARTSSATGLYQFIDSTWLETMQRHGQRFGFGDIAAQIGTARDGSAYVADHRQRDAILALRNDPQVAAFMAAGLAEDNRAHLAPILGREPAHEELYLAHFLGAGGAGRFLSEMAREPQQSAASLFARPAAANRAIFYDPGGSPRSLAEVMDVIGGKLARAGAEVASVGPVRTASDAMANAAVIEPVGRGTRAHYYPPVIAAQPVASTLPSRPASPKAMSDLLAATFDVTNGNGETLRSEAVSSQVRRAYDQLKGLGL